MSWTESLFQKAEHWIQHMDQKRKGIVPSGEAVSFEEMKSLLNCWCMLISGRSWTLQESETWPATDSERLFFPSLLEIFPDRRLNHKAYLLIACSLLGEDEETLPELRRWREEFQKAPLLLGKEDAQGFACLFQEGKINLKEQALVPNEDWGLKSFRSLLNLWVVRKLEPSKNRRDGEGDESRRNSGPQKEKKKKAREQIQVLDELGNPESENPLVHSFEKLHTTDDYNGGHKKQDGEDELAEHENSLEDLDLRQVIRSQQSTQATLKGDFVMDLEVAESLALVEKPSSQTFLYDEWDEAKALYHAKWCRLEENRKLEIVPSEFQLELVKKRKKREIEQLKKSFFSLFQSSRWKSRQSEGTELDLDSLVDLMSTPPEKRSEKMNVYMSRRKEISEMGIVLLFDRSLSSDSWIDNRRVLDITRESLVVIGEALKYFPLPVQLACFSSNTRNRITYDVLKDFDEDWQVGLKRLGSVQPSGYTRIGPALRHASVQLQKRKAQHRWILLLSDAKPTDYDKYEGRYGVRDVRKSIQEARMMDVGVRCLSVEKKNRYELAEMFGVKGYELLSQADHLPLRLAALLKSLVQLAT